MRAFFVRLKKDRLAFRVPELEELAKLIQADDEDKSAAYRKFIKSCAQDKGAIVDYMERHTTAHLAIGPAILKECGHDVELTELEEDEIKDAEMAAALVAIQTKEHDSKLALHPIVADVGPVKLRIIMRDPTEREVDSLIPKLNDGFECRAAVQSLTCWGSLDRLDHDAPGLWMALAKFALAAAGMVEKALVEKA